MVTKVYMFKGDAFITVHRGAVVKKYRPVLNGINDVKKIVSTPELLVQTQQYKIMISLGFKKHDRRGMEYTYDDGKDVTSVMFYNSQIVELRVNGREVLSVVLEVPDEVQS